MTDAPSFLVEGRDALAEYAITALKGIIDTTADAKVKLDAVRELNEVLALHASKREPRSAKQTNNFFGTGSPPVASIASRLDASAAARTVASAEAATRAELASLADDDE
jgi:hypothetical protein